MHKNKILIALIVAGMAMPLMARMEDNNYSPENIRIEKVDSVSAPNNYKLERAGEARTGDKTDDSSTSTKDEGENNGRGEERRSEVANIVHDLLQIADREGGIGQQLKDIVKEQEEETKTIDQNIKDLKGRSGFMKFFFGPDYRKLSETRSIVEKHSKNIEDIKNLKNQAKDTKNKDSMEIKIKAMEDLKASIEKDLNDSESGFSLFGWLNRWINR